MATQTNLAPIAEESISYFQQRMTAMRIEKMPTITVLAPEEEGAAGEEVMKVYPAFEADTHGNILINYWNIEGELFQRQKERSEKSKMGGYKVETYQRIRYAAPKGDKKYMPTSTGWGSMPYLPIKLVEAYKSKKVIKTLFITEGEFKANLGCEYGMYTIGIPGIQVITDGKEADGKLFHDIPKIIEACGVENVVILWDRDCRYCSMKDIENTNDATRRPRQFQSAALNLRNHLKDYDVDIWFYAITSPMYADAKGLDDLLLAASHKEALVLADEAQLYDGTPSHFFRTSIKNNQEKFFEFFALADPDKFYKNNAERIGYSRFLFGKDQIYKIDDENKLQLEGLAKLPKGVDPADFIKYGFYENAGRYWIIERNGNHKAITNFTMKIKFFIRSKKNPLRVVEISNCNGRVSQIDMAIGDLISIEKFETKIQMADALIFNGAKPHLNGIKEKLFNEEVRLEEIPNLGYVKRRGFWSWGNGITDDKGIFHAPDEFGVVNIDGDNFYLPASSSENKDDDDVFQVERKFAHRDSEANFNIWANLMYKVYGTNGAIGTAFAVISLYRDIILNHDKLPLLFCFGKKGTGKSVYMDSLMHLFGEPLETISLGGKSTTKGMMRVLSRIHNGLVKFDEYKNDMDKAMEKVELMKSTHDGFGNIQAQFTNDNTKTQSTTPKSNIICGGQHMPTLDPAFISRCIFLQFKTDKFTASKELYEELKQLQRKGLTSIVAELFAMREEFAKKFSEVYPLFVNDFEKKSRNFNIIDRQIKCWSMMAASVLALAELGLQFPYTPAKFAEWCYDGMIQQAGIAESSNEVKIFWDIVVYLIANNELRQGIDYLYDGKAIYLRLVCAHPKYMESHRRIHNAPGMGREILIEYFKSEPTFGGQHNKRFKNCLTTCLMFDAAKIKEIYSIDLAASIPHQAESVTFDDTEDGEV